MSSVTTKLNLYKANPVSDGNDNFNIDTMLNENWNKIDDFAGETITKDKLINNQATTEIGFALDARMGKTFGDEINTMNDTLSHHTSSLSELTNKVDNIKIADGTTSQKGIVKLNDTVTSTSIIEAATANAVRQAYARADSAFQYANNGKTSIANVIGYVTGSNTHAEITNEIQNDKNILANNLTKKNVNVNGNFALKDLVNKVSEISIASLGGANIKSGSTPISPYNTPVAPFRFENANSTTRIIADFTQLVSFTPKAIFCSISGASVTMACLIVFSTMQNGGYQLVKGTSDYSLYVNTLTFNTSLNMGTVSSSYATTVNWTAIG